MAHIVFEGGIERQRQTHGLTEDGSDPAPDGLLSFCRRFFRSFMRSLLFYICMLFSVGSRGAGKAGVSSAPVVL